MPTHSTYAIIIPFDLPSSSTLREIRVSNDGGAVDGVATMTQTFGNGIINDPAGFLTTFAGDLGTAYDNAGLNVGAGFSCYLNADGYIVIRNLDDLNCYLHNSDVTDNLGFGPDPVLLPTGGEEVVAMYHPKWLWCPRTPHRRDTGDQLRRAAVTSRTMTGRTVPIGHSDEWHERVIRWDTVPSALVRKSRAQDPKFAQAPPVDDTDPNAWNTLEFLVDCVTEEQENQAEWPTFYVLTSVTEDTDFLGGPYRINLQKSYALGRGVTDDNMLYTDTAKETYRVQLHLHKEDQ